MSVQAPLRPLPRAATVCRQCLFRLRNTSPNTTTTPSYAARQASSATKPSLNNVAGQRHVDPAKSLPRWAATPSAMKAPFRLKPSSHNEEFAVNENPERLDEMYTRMLGSGGDKLLEEHIKWLAVTHKSFDQGRRGFNERLGWLGRRMVRLQTSFALLNAPVTLEVEVARKRRDIYGRMPYRDLGLEGIESVSHYSKEEILDDRRLAHLAQESWGLTDVVRWRPKEIRELRASGVHTITAEAVYAIVGAIALSKGGELANRIIKEKILTPLLGKTPL